MTSITLELDHKGATQSVRFTAWVTLTAFSIVCLISTVSTASPPDSRSGAEKWALAVCSLSMIVGLFGVVAYLFARGVFLGTVLELVAVAAVSVLWGLGLPAIMNPNHAIAVQGTQVSNANIYFFSWACFAVCVYMVASLAQEIRGIDITKTNPKVMKWFVLLACGVIVLANGVRIFKAGQCGTSLIGHFCRRTKFAISAGVIASFISVAMIALAQVMMYHVIVEAGVALLLLVLWCFGVGFITFGISPGHAIGNMYFATWISFVMSVLLFSDCLREYLDAKNAAAVAATTTGDLEESSEKEQTPRLDDLNDLSFTEN